MMSGLTNGDILQGKREEIRQQMSKVWFIIDRKGPICGFDLDKKIKKRGMGVRDIRDSSKIVRN